MRVNFPSLVVLALASSLGCSDSSGPSNDPDIPGLRKIELVAGFGQSAYVGSTVALNPIVKLTRGDGSPAVGIAVSFAANAGSVGVSSVVTASDGTASPGPWTLGVVGVAANVLTVTAPGYPTYTLGATGMPQGTIAANSIATQSGTVGAPVTQRPSVIVRDATGNPRPGIVITFAVTAGGGTATGLTSTTDAGGIATVGSWTLGAQAGTNTLTASGAGFDGSPVTFTAVGSQPTLNGAWVGIAGVIGSSTQSTFEVTMTIIESNGVVSGSGTFKFSSGEVWATNINGSFIAATSQLTVTISSGLHPPTQLVGTATADRLMITGVFNGSGLVNYPVKLLKQ